MITKLKCKRCFHEWIRRLDTLPKACPKCRNPYWDKERKANLKLEWIDHEDFIELNKDSIHQLPVRKADRHEVLSKPALMDISSEYRKVEGDVWDKAGYLLRELVKKHPFASANRRTAVESALLFLRKNNQKSSIRNHPELKSIMQGVREDYYSKSEIKDWLMRGEIREFKR